SLVLIPRPPLSTLFPYTTLFRSAQAEETANPAGETPAEKHHGGQALAPTVNFRVTATGSDFATIRDILGGHQFAGKGTVHSRKRSEEHTSELQSRGHLVCRLLLE